MLDLKFVRDHLDTVQQALTNRNQAMNLDKFLELEKRRRDVLAEAESLKHQRNVVSKEISELKKVKQDAEDKIVEMRGVGDRIKELDDELKQIEDALHETLTYLPNIPHESVPVGPDETANVTVRQWGEKPAFGFAPQAHWDLGAKHDIFDFAAAAKISGSGFIVSKGLGARLERALINYFIDTHTTRHGYTEVMPPFLVTAETTFGTGQLPKFESELYKTKDENLYLIPTAEVPVTNILRDLILNTEDLPIQYVAYSPCFRREAGAAGKDTRGMIRVHQFNKVEMVRFVQPDKSWQALEDLTANAEYLLQQLGLPYRVLALSTGDLGFGSAKTYDLEVWAAGVGKWLEVSSCSNFTDFQARRANIRFRPEPGAKPQYIHTLNGSGLALPRVVIGIIENFQTEDGRIRIPKVLAPYMGGVEMIG